MKKVLFALMIALSFLTHLAFGQTAPAKPPVAKADSSPKQVGRASWTADRIDFSIGDIITVLIDERTSASAGLADNDADRRSRAMGLNVQPPATGATPTPPIAGNMSFENNANSQRAGQTSRQNAFQSEMSVRVVAISAGGMVQITGRKVVSVDKSKQEIEITGWVRPQDISRSTHSVPSYRIADAQITYVQQGKLGKPKSGIISRILGALWP